MTRTAPYFIIRILIYKNKIVCEWEGWQRGGRKGERTFSLRIETVEFKNLVAFS